MKLTAFIECEDCDGNGWVNVRRRSRLLNGTFEEDCPRCLGAGCIDNDGARYTSQGLADAIKDARALACQTGEAK